MFLGTDVSLIVLFIKFWIFLAWLAKFWNTEEVINDKLFEIQNILSLDSIPIVNDHDYKQAKRDTLNYLHKITKQKADNLNECESICQVESR